MALKQYNPTTPSQRELVQVDKSDLWKGKPYKSLAKGKINTGGRNNTGRITSWHRGGGHKKLYRFIDFKRSVEGEAVVERLEYDPNRTAFIALIEYTDKTKQYIVAPQGLKVGQKIIFSDTADLTAGNRMKLKNPLAEYSKRHKKKLLEGMTPIKKK
jgi:large subunit ribosomal protein L2